MAEHRWPKDTRLAEVREVERVTPVQDNEEATCAGRWPLMGDGDRVGDVEGQAAYTERGDARAGPRLLALLHGDDPGGWQAQDLATGGKVGKARRRVGKTPHLLHLG